jgi:1,2-diacylglycerol 3-alpha-glucosyltransferase
MKQLITGEFNDSLIPIMDGVGLVAKNYAYWLNRKYGKGYCIGPSVPGYTDTEDHFLRFPTVPLPGHAPYRYGLPFLGSFRKQLDEIPFDIVHAHCPFVSGGEALRVARKRNIPLVTTFHSKYREDFLSAFHSRYLADRALARIMKFYHQADMVWVPNEPSIDVLRSYGFKGHVEVAINGTDLISPDAEELARLKKSGYERSGASPEDFIMLFVGQHRWEKNVRLILEGLKIIHQQHQKFKVFFIGTGPEVKEMKQLTAQYKLTDNIQFKGVIKDREVLKSYYAITDVFLFPSLYDTASLVMREAAAFQVPTILVHEATTAKGITDEENGFLIDNTAEAFADKLLKVMKHPELQKKAGAGARATIYLPWEKIVDEVYERYIDIIDRRAHGNTSL